MAIKLLTTLSLLFALMGIESLPPSPVRPPEVEILAQLIRGEGYHLIHGSETAAGVALAHCVLNRGPHRLEEEAIHQFYGYTNNKGGPVQERDRQIAEFALQLWYAGHDVTAGATHVLSHVDLVAWDIKASADKATVILLSDKDPTVWGLYFFRSEDFPL